MKTQKTIYMVLVIIMVMAMAVSCNNTPGSKVQDTQDQPVIASREPGEDTSDTKPQQTLLFEANDGNFIYEEIEGGLAITGYNGDAEEIMIPESYNGKNVIEIGKAAFIQKEIVKVTIPDSVKKIKEEAFNSCKSLTTVIMGNGIEEIGEFAFFLNTMLTEIQLSNSLRIIGEQAFASTTKLETIQIPISVTIIEYYAFSESGIKTITIPKNATVEEGVETLKGGIFGRCSTIKEVYIPASVKEIGDGLLFEANNSAVIITPAGSYAETYAKENGITYRNQ